MSTAEDRKALAQVIADTLDEEDVRPLEPTDTDERLAAAILAAGFSRTPAPAPDVQALIDEARRAQFVVYLATDAAVADDISRIIRNLADALEAAEKELGMRRSESADFERERDEAVAALEASQNGSCWDQGPTLPVREGECGPMPPLCELRAGHLGAHKGGAAEWMTRQPAPAPREVTDEMVERAAYGMYLARPIELGQGGQDDWAILPDEWKHEWREAARAALEAALGVSAPRDTEWEYGAGYEADEPSDEESR